MKAAVFELLEMVKEDGHESSNILGSLFRGALVEYALEISEGIKKKYDAYHIFAMISIRETNTDRLVDEKYVRICVP